MLRTPLRALAPLALLSSLVACSSPAEVGQECEDSADCVEGAGCFAQGAGADAPLVCMSDCDRATTRICDDGAVCTEVTPNPARPMELGVCYLGGSAEVGAPCTLNSECVRGSICIDTGSITACFRACATDDGSHCEEGETCRGLSDGGTTDGFCQPEE